MELDVNSLFFRCFNGGQCIDGVDTYNCNCQDGYFGNNCECPPEAVDDPSLCLNVNESVSWEVRNRTIGKASCFFLPKLSEFFKNSNVFYRKVKKYQIESMVFQLLWLRFCRRHWNSSRIMTGFKIEFRLEKYLALSNSKSLIF